VVESAASKLIIEGNDKMEVRTRLSSINPLININYLLHDLLRYNI
jgi:hypothetical protein